MITGPPPKFNGTRHNLSRVGLAPSVHPDQPLGDQWLHAILAPMEMRERDRRWTAQIRGKRASDSPYSTLIYWCRTAPAELLAVAANGGRSFARLAAEVLMWALPSPDRFLRDAATRALVAMADHDTVVIRDLFDAVRDVDDAYVLERVLAVACASQLRGKADTTSLLQDIKRLLDKRGLPCDVLSR